MILASHGIIGSSIGQFVPDVDAAAFFQRVTDSGGTLSATEQSAVNQLVLDMKDDGIWDSMIAIYPMVGASAAACAQNLKSSSFTGTFTATGWTFASTGVTPDGTAHMDTNLNPSTSLSLNSVHFSNYFPNFAAERRTQIGAITASLVGLYAYYNYTGLGALIRTNDNKNTFNAENQGAQSGLRIVTRTASNLSKVYVNNTNTFSSSSASTGLPNVNIYVGARNFNNTSNDMSSLLQSFCSIGEGLTDAEAGFLYTAVQAFQTTLGRAVAP